MSIYVLKIVSQFCAAVKTVSQLYTQERKRFQNNYQSRCYSKAKRLAMHEGCTAGEALEVAKLAHKKAHERFVGINL